MKNRFLLGAGASTAAWLQPSNLPFTGGWSLTLGYERLVEPRHGVGFQVRISNHPVNSRARLNLGAFDPGTWFWSLTARYCPVLYEAEQGGALFAAVWLGTALMAGTPLGTAGEFGAELGWRLSLQSVELAVSAQVATVMGMNANSSERNSFEAAVLPAIVVGLRI